MKWNIYDTCNDTADVSFSKDKNSLSITTTNLVFSDRIKTCRGIITLIFTDAPIIIYERTNANIA